MNQPSLSAIDILRTRTLASLAAQEIERMILAGELQAGERLNELGLAAKLGISRGPIREAVRGLERGGLVVTVVNQGSFVRKVSAEEARELYDVRIALTGHACVHLARHATPEQIKALRDLVRRMSAAQIAADAAGYYALNLDFHSALMQFSGNRRALRINEEIGHELNLFRRRSLVSVEGMRASNAEHAEMVRAIAARDEARAREAGETHIAHGMRRFAATEPRLMTEPIGAEPLRASPGAARGAGRAARRRRHAAAQSGTM
jgi:DNA-binding GntR family transcriptional regulator